MPVKSPRIIYDEKDLVKKVADGSIIERFDKTPYPVKPTDVVCPHSLELKWAYGCPFDCSWCYLKGTFRFRPKGIEPGYKPLEKVKLHVETFLRKVETPEILNTGEIADSLMGENGDCPFSKFIISLFEWQDRHKILYFSICKRRRNDFRSLENTILTFETRICLRADTHRQVSWVDNLFLLDFSSYLGEVIGLAEEEQLEIYRAVT